MAALAPGCHFGERPRPSVGSQVACRQLAQQGISALDDGQWNQASGYIANAVKTCPVDPDAHRHYAEALWHQADHEQALAELDEALSLAPDDPQAQVLAARFRLELQQYEQAIQWAEGALDLDPKSADAWAVHGQITKAMNQLPQALADFQRALSYEPRRADWLLEVAELYRRMNRPQQALANLQALADLYPPGEEPAKVMYLLGLAYSAIDRYDEAIDAYALAIARGGPRAGVLFHQADAMWRAGRATDAKAALREALVLEPRHEPSRTLLAKIEQADPASRTMLR